MKGLAKGREEPRMKQTVSEVIPNATKGWALVYLSKDCSK